MKPSKNLKKYQSKRDLKTSKEPQAKKGKSAKAKLQFVIQKHEASRLHYDFRLEMNGVLKSWAIPKGPSLNPKDKRFAKKVEDHPFDYKDFEGIIPSGYGKGRVLIWDRGDYLVAGMSKKESERRLLQGLEKGALSFILEGEKLKGGFTLVRINDENDEWILLKKRDAFADEIDITQKDKSPVSNLSLDEMGMSKEEITLLKKGKKRKKPTSLKPMLPKDKSKPFSDRNWVFEIDLQEKRALCFLDKGEVHLDFPTDPGILRELKSMKLDAILDGEIATLDDGTTYFIYDLIYLNGKDLRDLTLLERKKILKNLFAQFNYKKLAYWDHVEDEGEQFALLCKKKGLKAMVAKKKNSKYKSGKSSDWIKIPLN